MYNYSGMGKIEQLEPSQYVNASFDPQNQGGLNNEQMIWASGQNQIEEATVN